MIDSPISRVSLALVCAVLLVVASVAVVSAEPEPSMVGDGTEDDPYEISNASELQAMENNLSEHYILVDDVTDADSFDPIGSDPDSAFTGTFDGNGHTISGLTIDESTDYVGLFGVIGDDSLITNVTIADVDISGDNNVGGLAGRSEGGGVHGVTVTGTVSSEGGDRTGGLLGANEKGTVRDSHASVSVANSWSMYVGGLVGANEGSIFHSSADGAVTNEHGTIGGLVGWHTDFGDIKFSHASGDVSSDSGQVGGLVGKADGRADITDSYASGDVTTESTNGKAGGLVGEVEDAYTKIERSYATGTVNAIENEFGNIGGSVGGLVGDHGGGTIDQSYATGSVNANDGVGGLVGTTSGDITGSFAVGSVSGSEDVGGLVGIDYDSESDSVTDSYWDVAATEQNSSDGGVGFGSTTDTPPTEEMIGENASENMAGLNFEAVWVERTDPDEYPALTHEDFEDAVTITSSDVYTEIDVPGVYELQNNVSSDETVIEIAANDVVLDGQGHTIAGVDSPDWGDYGVDVDGATNVTVTNLTIEGWGEDSGVYADESSDITIRNVDAQDNRNHIQIRRVDGFTIESVRAEGGGMPGVELVDVSNGVVTDVTVIGTDDEDWGGAIRLSESWNTETSNVTLDTVTAKHSESAGIAIESSVAPDITVRNATTSDNAGSGMVIESEAVEVTDSRATDNGEYGIRLAETSETTLTNVEARSNDENALRIDGDPDVTAERIDIGDSTAPNTTLSISEAADAELGGTTAPETAPGDLHSINRYVEAQALNQDSILDITMKYEEADISAIDESSLSLWVYDGEWSEIDGVTVDSTERTISATVEEFSTIGAYGEEEGLVPDFSFDPDEPEVGEPVAFDASESVSLNDSIETYRWNFTDDGTFEVTAAEPETTWTFDEDDEYEVTLEIEDEAGETAQTTETVLVEEGEPEPATFEITLFDILETDVETGEEFYTLANITNTGEETGLDAARLKLDGEELENESVALDPGERETVSFAHDAPDEEGNYTISIETSDDTASGTLNVTEPEPATFKIDWLDILETEVETGDEFYVLANITNTGEEPGLDAARLKLDGEELENQTVYLEPGERETVSFAHDAPNEEGNYTISIETQDDIVTETLNVTEPEPATFEITLFDILETEVETGDELYVLANITNTGEETGLDAARLKLDGEELENESVYLEPGERDTVTFANEAPDEPGQYTVSIETQDDHATGELTVGPNFQILDADMPVDVDQGDNATVEFVIENEGSHGTQLVNFTAYASEQDDDDDEEELIDASVAVVDDSRDTTLGEAYVNVLENEFETVDLVTTDTVLDEMADYDAFVIYNFVTDTLAEDFFEKLDDDQGVVYLDDPEIMWPQEYWADGVYRLHNVREDPGYRDSITNNASGDPPEVTITTAHPIFDGVGEVGETVILNDNTERATGGSWFGAYSGDVLAEVDYGVHENADDVDEEDVIGPGIGVNNDENEVLLPALIHRNELEHVTPEGEALIVNSVAHVAPDVDGTGHTAATETDDSDDGDDEFPFFGEVVIHIWDELTLDADETTTFELEYEVPENLAPDLYTQELSTESDAVISELWVELEPDIEVTSYSLDPDPAEEDLNVGETLTAETVVANHGDRPGEFEVEYIVDEEVVANETVEIDAAATETVELEYELQDGGSKVISVNGVDPVQIDVEGPEADIEVVSYTPDPDPEEEHLFVGDTLAVEANITNYGELSSAFEVNYIVDEEVVSNVTVALAGSEEGLDIHEEVNINDTSGYVTLEHELREPGTKIVSVNGEEPRQITVESEPQADIEVTSYTLEPDPEEQDVQVGDRLAAEINVTNHGTASGEFEVEYIVDEEVVSSAIATVEPNSTITGHLIHELREDGTKILSVNGVDPVQINVDEAKGDIEVTSFTLDPDPSEEVVFVGDTITAEAVLTNHGNESGEIQVNYLRSRSVRVDKKRVEVDANSTETVELEYELQADGIKWLRVNSLRSDRLFVHDEISVTSYTLDPDPEEEDLFVGDTLTAEAVVTNSGNTSNSLEVEFAVGRNVVDNQTVEVDANSTETVELEYELETAELSKRIRIDNWAMRTSISVKPEPESNIPLPPGTDSEDEASDDEESDDAPTVDTEEQTDETGATVEATVENAEAGEWVGVDVPEPDQSQPYQLDEVGMTPASDGDFELDIETSTDPLGTTPDGTFAFEGTEELGYLNVDTDLANADIEAVSFTFTVDEDAIDDMESSPEDVSLYRYDEETGEWVEQDTEVVEQADGEVTLETMAEGFSDWTAAAKTPELDITDTEIDIEVATTDEDVTIQVFVTNTGGTDGTYEAQLVANDDIVDREDATVPSNRTVIIDFVRTFDQPDTYEVQVNDVTVGEITVEEGSVGMETPTPTDETQDDDADEPTPAAGQTPGDDTDAGDAGDDPDDDGGGLDGFGDGFGALAAVVALLLLCVRVRSSAVVTRSS